MATHGSNAVKLQALTDKHRNVASLLAQGLGRSEIAQVIDFTPEYVTWLTRDPLFKEYLREMAEHAEARHEAMFALTADVVADAMTNGSVDERLKGARLNLEVTGRLGKNDRPNAVLDSSLERLSTIAQRLLSLQSKVRNGEIINGQVQRIEDSDQQASPA